jgi:ketose-bisphosphate aldolase
MTNQMASTRPANVVPLKTLLQAAEAGHYAVGSFSPRMTAMIQPVLKAGQALRSPLIVQISQKELDRYQVTPAQFADAFYRQVHDLGIDVPVTLHLDHTRVLDVIEHAIEAGFTSVMIDASEKPFDENVAMSRQVVEMAHARGVSVEAELGKIGTTDFVETDKDEELYTDPLEAEQFVRETGVDALAVSCGTAHGVYVVRQPKIDYARLEAIRALSPVHLVLHGGSGVPAGMMHRAISLPNGGVSKVNIATDLEIAALAALGRGATERFTNEELNALPEVDRQKAQDAVRGVVEDKMRNFVKSAGQATRNSGTHG